MHLTAPDWSKYKWIFVEAGAISGGQRVNNTGFLQTPNIHSEHLKVKIFPMSHDGLKEIDIKQKICDVEIAPLHKSTVYFCREPRNC